MTLKKQTSTSTESSSGSSSDSSSSGSSSSTSGSGSSTSDTDSTSSPASPVTVPSSLPSLPVPPPVSIATTSASTSSAATTSTSGPAPRRPTPRRSTDNPATAAKPAPAVKQQDKVPNSKSKPPEKATPLKPINNRKASASSSEEETPTKVAEVKPLPPRRRSTAKSKGPLTAINKQTKSAGKQMPTRTPTKTETPKSTNASKPDNKKPFKKKSIFSPDNSTESESESTPKTNNKPGGKTIPASQTKAKGRPAKNNSGNSSDRGKSSSVTNETKPKDSEATARQKRGSVTKPPPVVKKKNEKDKSANGNFKSKAFVSSCSSTNTESTASGSSSDSDSSVSSRKSEDSATAKKVSVPAKKAAGIVAAKFNRSKTVKVDPVKVEKNTPNKDATAPPGTDSDVENTKPASNTTNVTRKLTRSASARKSRHVVGRPLNSDTDSDNEADPTKRSTSKSPVKRAIVSSKGPPALLCPMKGRGNIFLMNDKRTGIVGSPHTLVPEKEQELRCPLPGCDSLGHLSGKLEKHFTIEACPTYHNTTPEECKARAAAARVQQDSRKLAAQQLATRRTSQPSIDHRAYQLKIRDLRTKWKQQNAASSGEVKQEKPDGLSTSGTEDKCGEREPDLQGFVPDYDLALFREAQAAAAFKIEEELKNMPPSKGTRYVCMGKYCMEAWYQSPYPPDAARLPQLYLCEFCLNHHKTATGIMRHRAKCVWRHPPGDEVYRKGRLGVWQVDGRRHKQYCQQLCLLAKFFLDHKTLYYDVEPFLFYVMTLADSEGCHTVGYFSKEKNSLQNYNVSCILTLPPYQRQGYGRLLIDFSYLLTRVEGKIGSPEKPLSDLGLISYRSYWKDVLLQYLCAHPGPALSIKDLSQEMAINSYDIVSTLQALGMMKYWKGKHIILKRQDVLDEYMERVKKRGHVKTIDPSCLRWTPFVPPSSQGNT